ncbi:MAG: GNAT family N-acetyltransferase [Thaumarchaeota archaeon]|nr:GNAT family N-acetyltransferase [Nitrososphaerota archaeon]
MSESRETKVSEIWDASDIEFVFPNGFSFFEPYLEYHVKEILEIGGEAYVSRTSEGAISGIFIYDDFEKTGTIFTRSREVFDYFYDLKPFDFLFAELKTEHQSEVYDIHTIDLENLPAIVHRFSHEISMAQTSQIDELEQFMVSTNSRLNKRWVKVAFKNCNCCFIVRLGNEIAGVGWLSLVNRVGRLHSLYVKPQFRRIGIGEDILYARLLWLKSMRARSAFSEISRLNSSSSRIAMKGNMMVSGQIYLYFKKDLGRPIATEKLSNTKF